MTARPILMSHEDVRIDAGDTVFHRPTRETWLVACVEDDRLSWCGWPAGWAEVSDCLLVEKALPAERVRLLKQLARTRKPHDHRVRYARRVIAEMQVLRQNVDEVTHG